MGEDSFDENVIAEALRGEEKKKCIVTKRSFEEGHMWIEAYTTDCGEEGYQIASALLGQINMKKGLDLHKVCEKVDQIPGIRVVGTSQSLTKATISNPKQVSVAPVDAVDLAKQAILLQVGKQNIRGSIRVYDVKDKGHEYQVDVNLTSYGEEYCKEGAVFHHLGPSQVWTVTFNKEGIVFGIAKEAAKVYQQNLPALVKKCSLL
jgi:hypothetical protein